MPWRGDTLLRTLTDAWNSPHFGIILVSGVTRFRDSEISRPRDCDIWRVRSFGNSALAISMFRGFETPTFLRREDPVFRDIEVAYSEISRFRGAQFGHLAISGFLTMLCVRPDVPGFSYFAILGFPRFAVWHSDVFSDFAILGFWGLWISMFLYLRDIRVRDFGFPDFANSGPCVSRFQISWVLDFAISTHRCRPDPLYTRASGYPVSRFLDF